MLIYVGIYFKSMNQVKNEIANSLGYPVFVRMSKSYCMNIDIINDQISEKSEVNISFLATQQIEQIREKGDFYIFVSEKAFYELSKNKIFASHYTIKENKGNWYATSNLSAETKNELLQVVMSSKQALYFSNTNWRI